MANWVALRIDFMLAKIYCLNVCTRSQNAIVIKMKRKLGTVSMASIIIVLDIDCIIILAIWLYLTYGKIRIVDQLTSN